VGVQGPEEMMRRGDRVGVMDLHGSAGRESVRRGTSDIRSPKVLGRAGVMC
jgi:hypothetical protein